MSRINRKSTSSRGPFDVIIAKMKTFMGVLTVQSQKTAAKRPPFKETKQRIRLSTRKTTMAYKIRPKAKIAA